MAMDGPGRDKDLSELNPHETRLRQREWNRGPLTDLFPRIPDQALETVLDKCSDKHFHYNLSHSKLWNARRLTAIVIAHVRHFHTDYDKLLHDHVERYDARRQVGPQIWKVLREWCPWDADNEALETCFQTTLLPPSERDPTWDPMDIDDDSDAESSAFQNDPMDID